MSITKVSSPVFIRRSMSCLTIGRGFLKYGGRKACEKFDPGHRGDIEVGDRAELLFPHDRQN